MKRIALIFSLLFLMAGAMFGQQGYIRTSKVYLVDGTPTFTPNKYRGSIMAIDTANSDALYIYNYAADTWTNEVNATLAAGLDLGVDSLNVIEATIDSIDSRIVTADSLDVADYLAIGGEYRVPNDKIVAAATGTADLGDYLIIVNYTTTGTATITLDSDLALLDGYMIVIIDGDGNASGNNITIDTEGSETINGAASVTISTDGGNLTIRADGTNFVAW